MAKAVADGSATVGRVPAWPQEGHAGTDGLDFGIVYLAEMEVAFSQYSLEVIRNRDSEL